MLKGLLLRATLKKLCPCSPLWEAAKAAWLARAPPSRIGESASSFLERCRSPEISLFSDSDHDNNNNEMSYGRLKSKILKTAWGSYNLPSLFLLLFMALSVRCCQHAQENNFSAPKDLQSKDLILHTVVYNCTTQAYMC